MATQQLENPVTRHRAQILERTAALLKMRFWIPPQSDGSPLHYHRVFQEEFQVLEGSMTVEWGRRLAFRTLEAGSSLQIPEGQLHGFANRSAHWLVFDATLQPAAEFADFIACMYGLAAAGKTNAAGTPKNPLALLRILQMGDVWLPGIPVVLQQGLFLAARWLAAHSSLEAELDTFRSAL